MDWVFLLGRILIVLGLAGGAAVILFAYHELQDEAPLSATDPLFA